MRGFVGREEAMRAYQGMRADGGRLITITGTAGIGKTRFAQEVGSKDWLFVDLSHASSLEDFLRASMDVIAGQSSDGVPPGRLTQALRALGPAHLVLDNFEQLVPVAADTVRSWLAELPELLLLITSREPLRIPGEQVLELGPLGLPHDELAGLEADSVRLLLDAVRSRRPTYKVAPADNASLMELVKLLDGIPLAIELAAPRLLMLGPRTLLERMGDRFAVLRQGESSLVAAIQSSWDLLSNAERTVLAQCSCFQGGFDIAAVEAVVRLNEATSILETLQSLFDKSLLTAADNRFGMFLSIQEFARARLDDVAATLLRHAKYYATLADDLLDFIDSARAVEGWQGLRRERDNLQAAADQADDPNLAARATLALAELRLWYGTSDDLDSRLSVCIDASADLRSRLLLERGLGYVESGRLREAETDLTRAVTLAKREDRGDIASEALRGLSRVEYARGHVDSAIALLRDRAIPVSEQLLDRLEEARNLLGLGHFYSEVGKVNEADEALRRGLLLARERGAMREQAYGLGTLAYLLATTRRGQEALPMLVKAEEIQEALGTPLIDRLFTQWIRGCAHMDVGSYAQAEQCFQAVQEGHVKYGADFYLGHSMGNVAIARLFAGSDLAECTTDLESAANEAARGRDQRSEVLFLAFAGGAAARAGRTTTARMHFKRARTLVQELRDDVLPLIVDLQSAHLDPKAVPAVLMRARTDSNGDGSLYDINLDVRLATRTHEMNDPFADLRTPAGASAPTLLVDREGGRIVAPGSSKVEDLRARHGARRILWTLVDSHRLQPGTMITIDALASAGWPGEVLEAKTALNRVRVTINALRKLGLREAITSGKGAYRLHSAIAVREVSLTNKGGPPSRQ